MPAWLCKYLHKKNRLNLMKAVSFKDVESVLLLLQLIFWYHQEVYNGVSR